MAGTRAKALTRCKQPMVLEATAVMQSADKVRLLMVQTFIYSAVMYGAEVEHDSGQRTRCQQS
jgi:hypothetical protein